VNSRLAPLPPAFCHAFVASSESVSLLFTDDPADRFAVAGETHPPAFLCRLQDVSHVLSGLSYGNGKTLHAGYRCKTSAGDRFVSKIAEFMPAIGRGNVSESECLRAAAPLGGTHRATP